MHNISDDKLLSAVAKAQLAKNYLEACNNKLQDIVTTDNLTELKERWLDAYGEHVAAQSELTQALAELGRG